MAKGTFTEVCAAPDDLCDRREPHRDRPKDEVSGYALIRNEEEANRIIAKIQGKRLLGIA